MSEHLHEFALLTDLLRNQSLHEARCIHCDRILSRSEIERRLNATDRLSADTAGVASQVFRMGANTDIIRPFGGHDPLLIFEALADYAAALEGEGD